MKVFTNCMVVLEFDSSMSYKEKDAWRKKITDNGGVISYIFTRKVSLKCTTLTHTVIRYFTIK